MKTVMGRKTGRILIKCALAAAVAVLAAMLILSFTAKPMKAEAAGPEVTLASKGNRVPVYQAGKEQSWAIEVTNHTAPGYPRSGIFPEMGSTNEEWPFVTDYQNYGQTIDLPAGKTVEAVFTFTQREDVPTARYTIAFSVETEEKPKAYQKFYVNTTAKEKKPEASGNQQSFVPAAAAEPEGQGAVPVSADAGGFSNGDAVYSGGTDDGGTASGSGSVPRVIVTGFSTDPAEVRAGDDFTLTIHLKNTSTATRVANMLFDLQAPTEGTEETQAPAFLPVSGSSSVFLNGIAAGQAADISLKLNARADLLQKPYSVNLSMKYEDGNAQQIEADSLLSVPVKQEARFEFGEFEISPESIAVGEEANVMTSLYNLGRTKLYNVKAVFEGTGIKTEEVFVGNVESGASASIDAMLEASKPTKGPAKVTMKMIYEDEAGNPAETTKDLQLEVTEDDGGMEAAVPTEEENSGFPLIPVAAAALVVVAGVIAAVILVRRKKRRTTDEEEELLDELDRSSEDEQQ